jgi:hypothetical protein
MTGQLARWVFAILIALAFPAYAQVCQPQITCNAHGACNPDGSCDCAEGYAGPQCGSCAPNYYQYPVCRYCQAAATCNNRGSCDVSGFCACSAGYAGPNCAVRLAQPRGDLDGDGRSDVLWRNVASGDNYVYPMNGTAIGASEGYVRTVADQNWQIAGVGDFNGDGRADLLWRNDGTGENYIYLMGGTTVSAEGYLRSVADPNWRVVGIGDFDADGKADILWRNSSTGENYAYLMDGLAIKPGEGYLRTVADAAWKVAGIGDFDRDGTSDILWRNANTGENYLYPMNGLAIRPSEGYVRTVADLDWEVAGVGDFDGDTRADILWRNRASGENYLYPMDGAQVLATEGYLRTVSDISWRIAALGDYDGDGKGDILWRHAASGANYLYFLDGRNIKPTEGYTRTVSEAAWRIVGMEHLGEPAELAGITMRHNQVRAAVQTTTPLPPLQWDAALAATAAAWAVQCQDTQAPAGLIDHNPNRSIGHPYYVGENIFGSGGNATAQQAVNTWAAEQANYNYANNTCNGVCAHYTQLVWRNTLKLGCAKHSCTGLTFGNSIVCNYGPGGNTGGRPY